MADWFPEKGQKFFCDVEVVEVAERGAKTLIKYEPAFTQQRAARHELEIGQFAEYFKPAEGRGQAIVVGSRWRMEVTVLEFIAAGQRVRFRHDSQSGRELGGEELPVHLFNAAFRAERAGNGAAEPDRKADYVLAKARSLQDVRLPATGEVWELRVTVLGIEESEQSGIHVKYRPIELPGLMTDKELPERDFAANFENEDRGMTDINVGATWVMRVRVVDIDDVEDAVWYRRETGKPEGRAIIKRMSSHVFVASFAPPANPRPLR